MELVSEKIMCSAPVSEIYSFLSADFANYREVMPVDVEHFESDDTSFVFGMKGVPHIRLISKGNVSNERIVLTAASSKLDFDLTLHLAEENGETSAYFQFEGDFNPMMQMMIKKPLQSFIDKLINQIKSRFSS